MLGLNIWFDGEKPRIWILMFEVFFVNQNIKLENNFGIDFAIRKNWTYNSSICKSNSCCSNKIMLYQNGTSIPSYQSWIVMKLDYYMICAIWFWSFSRMVEWILPWKIHIKISKACFFKLTFHVRLLNTKASVKDERKGKKKKRKRKRKRKSTNRCSCFSFFLLKFVLLYYMFSHWYLYTI